MKHLKVSELMHTSSVCIYDTKSGSPRCLSPNRTLYRPEAPQLLGRHLQDMTICMLHMRALSLSGHHSTLRRRSVDHAPSVMTFALLSGNSNAVELASEQYTRPSGSRYTTIACLLPGMMTDLIILPSCTTLACVSPRSSLANCSTGYQWPGHCRAAPESPMHQQHCTSLLLDPFPACPFWPADSSTLYGKL
jgi:hypothetical protein